MEEFPKAYNPQDVEEKWYSYWEKNGFFKADSKASKEPYTIVIPPPNVTGVLHMGHALVDTLQDILIRWKRMCGYETLWVPGTDHAGIATQTVVERNLLKTVSKRRSDFSREEFLEHVWKWKNESEQLILNQIKKVGCSCDWDRLAFTMDEPRSRAVRTMFKKMYQDGLIYRGDYLVNWDPVTQTALADDEVEYEEKESHLYYIRYKIPESTHYLVVATVRPETLLGDTAVAVSPEDIRYQTFIGKPITIPLAGRNVPVIGDIQIDPKFGTGVVKVTPAHDADDYVMAQRHYLPMINIMTPDGRINENGGEFQGLTMEEARKAVVEKLKSLGLIEKIEKYKNRVGVSYRSKAVIEPYLSKQWFVKMSHFKEKLIDLVKSKKVKLIPETFENTYFHWIHNLRDWCISRQLWWGHRIPIWYRVDNPALMICYDGEGVPPEVAKDPSDWVQDPDVLDTWFSSALWPFSVMGWPEKTPDMAKFYPTSVLVTGHDILFFWVARMIMMGEYALHTPPFSEVFLHGLIFGKSYWRYNGDGSIAYLSSTEFLKYDAGQAPPPEVQSRWEKMSKSKGNIIDPLEIINVYGADAMRMALAASTTHARQIDLDRRRFEEFKNFANKIWNGARFVFMNLEGLEMDGGIDLGLLSLEDKWILSRLNRIIEEVNASLHEYAFDKAALAAYDFFWKEFCAYYLEMTKPTLFGKQGTPDDRSNKQKILLVVLCNAIRLLHPMAPFITEELFQLLKKQFSFSETRESTQKILPSGLCQSPGDSTIDKGGSINPIQPPLSIADPRELSHQPGRQNLLSTLPKDPYTQETLKALQSAACIVAPYPKVIRQIDIDPSIEEEFTSVDQLVHAIRNIRAEMQIPPGTPTSLHFVGPKERLDFAEKHQGILKSLVRLESLSFTDKEAPIPFASTTNIGDLRLIIPLPSEMREKEKARLLKEQEKLIEQQNGARTKLGNQDFLQKAPPQLVEKLQLNLQQAEKDLFEIAQKLEKL